MISVVKLSTLLIFLSSLNEDADEENDFLNFSSTNSFSAVNANSTTLANK